MSPKAHYTLCALLLAYLAGDFFVFNGPLKKAVHTLNPDSPQSIEQARKEGVVARVGKRPISASQVERAAFESLTLEGKFLKNLTEAERLAAQRAALEQLIQEELLLAEIHALDKPVEVGMAEVDEQLGRLTARFAGDRDALISAMKSQGISSESALRDRIATRIRVEKHVAAKISATAGTPTEEEVKKWFDANGKEIALPERVEARHIFIPSISGPPPEEAKKTLEEALAKITSKAKAFPDLAKEISQDPSSKDHGGNLGWMSRARLSPDLAEPLFTLPVNQPTLVRSRLGWHLIEVTARKGAEPRPFEDAKGEIIAALEAVKRRDAIRSYRENLRKNPPVPVRILQPELKG